MQRLSHKFIFAIIIGIFILDLITKLLVKNYFSLGEVLTVIPNFFNLTYRLNDGVAFSMLANMPYNYLIFSIIAISVSIFIMYIIIVNKSLLFFERLGYTFIVSGALGNANDRIFFKEHAVVDFLDFYYKGYHWPAFNVADSVICIGVALLFFNIIFAAKFKQIK